MIPEFVRKRFGGLTSALAIRLSGRALSFLIALILARELGVEGFGIYSFATTWVTVLLVVAGLGYGGLLIRQTAVFVERDQPEYLLGIIRTARNTIVPLSVGLALLASAAAALFFDPIFLAALLIGLPTVVVRSFAVIWDGVLRGLGRIDESFVSAFVVYPILMLAGVGLAVLFTDRLTPESAIALYLAAFSVASLASWLLARRRLRPVVGETARIAHPVEGRFSLLVPFTILTMLGSISASLGLILLGLLDLPDAVGELQVAKKLIEPISLVMSVVATSLAALIATLYARGEVGEARPTIARTVRLSLLGAVPVALVLLLAPDFVLGLFGEGFDAARTALLVLIPAALFEISAGAAQVALMMSRHQRHAIVATGVGLAVNLALCLVLIPTEGATGAAIGLAADIIVTNAISVVMAWKLLGLNTTVLPTPGWLGRTS